MKQGQRLLLDTCAFLYIAERRALRPQAIDLLKSAIKEENIYVSPLSAWEIGRSVARGRLKLSVPPFAYYQEFLRKPGVSQCELSAEVLVATSYLPGLEHKDPMDRAFIATARHHDFVLVTDDREILAYGAQGHVKTLPC